MTRQTVFSLALLIGFFSAATMAHSAEDGCSARLAAIAAKVYPGAKALPDNAFEVDGKTLTLPEQGSMGDDPHAMLCRIWPARPELMLVAVPLVDNPRQQDGNEGDLDMLVLDRQSLDVKGRYRVEGLMSDDAIFITELAFDTAFYQLAPGNVAFGLRKATRGSSSPNPYNDTTLWLFAIEGQQLKPVLENLVVAKFGGEWDMSCNGEFDSVNRTLTMAPTKSPMADIIVSDTLVHRLSEGTAEVCKDTEKTTTAKHRLRFKNGSYEVPKALSGF
ncbi:hypothetical protein GAO09_15825 [Rhizobiales bacterium RZME27]|jgi:hypothetical protein|uniref:Uncharacterized protein n=1 Tax=Endobacterium cereale TaxID=2663029 RepID=A0A6A8A8E9_9HYPH|nr:hypothetical protein [Endobacterium cereale]MEB2847080.1 hypothetical protein [Endobacterium cereale]MQY47503.1 hypothetical protein [Endobacterium cereale]